MEVAEGPRAAGDREAADGPATAGGPELIDGGPGTTDGPGLTDGGPGTTDGPGLTDGGPGTTDGGPELTDGGPELTDGGPGTTDGPGLTDGGPGLTDGGPGTIDDRGLPEAAVSSYRMLETIRAFAAGQRVGERALRDARAGYFLRLAERAEPCLRGGGQLPWLARLEAERDNLDAAVAHLTATDPAAALRLMAALTWFRRLRGPAARRAVGAGPRAARGRR
ncbi:hypothetical protein ACIBBD_19180 [Streptomyces sp. NPDC051315]|uniref:hypothetical protein n=1 Tax=Streptomyces sp. NPDC051315 TaxID=3365650 RepID=UPI0037AAA615